MAHTAKFVISRATGIGEQTSAEVIVSEGRDLYEQLQPIYHALDKRVWVKNLWMQSHIKVLRTLPKEVQLGVIECIDILHGQRTIPDYILKALDEEGQEEGVLPEALKTEN